MALGKLKLRTSSICGSLNESAPHGLIHLNTWSLVGGCLGRIRWYGLASVSLSFAGGGGGSKDVHYFKLALIVSFSFFFLFY